MIDFYTRSLPITPAGHFSRHPTSLIEQPHRSFSTRKLIEVFTKLRIKAEALPESAFVGGDGAARLRLPCQS
jgi:hypothetical protein